MLKCLDLCAGLGGFSEAFLRSPHWEVMRIDNNPLLSEVENMSIMCIFEFRDVLHDMIQRGYKPDKVDLVVASPPCLEFSTGFSSPRSQASRDGTLDEYKPNMDIVLACKEIIDMLKPTYFIIENVRGAVRYFKPYLGNFRQSFDSRWYFWGNFPTLRGVIVENLPEKRNLDTWSSDPLRMNKKSVIPLEISTALKQAVEEQRTLDFWTSSN